MVALSVDSAKNIGLIVAAALLVFTLGSAWLIKNITTKLITAAILGILCIGVWTQRSNLQDCAAKAKERLAAGDTRSITCSFLGSDIDLGLSGE
jgi:cobalamin biosynthesis protein CobD/CbiB